ncbi:MAG: hypothetical protein ACP5RJ_08910, partial [Conexivisphaera sp.]
MQIVIAELLVAFRIVYGIVAFIAALWASRARFRRDIGDAMTIAFLGLGFSAVAPEEMAKYGLGVAIGAFFYAFA